MSFNKRFNETLRFFYEMIEESDGMELESVKIRVTEKGREATIRAINTRIKDDKKAGKK